MRLFSPLAKIDEEQRLALGYASTEAVDCQGEVVKREALLAALPDYLKYANIREMHQPSAVGVTHEAGVDDKGLYIKAHIVDPLAWQKVRAGVYKGFSIGGRVTARDPESPNVITGIDLYEISLVDRPANPEAMIDVWKSDAETALAKEGRRNSQADQDKLNQAHEAIVAAGAECPVARAHPHGDSASMAAEAESLKKAVGDLGAENALLKAELEALKRQPAPPKGRLRAVSKADDLGLPEAGATAPAEPERTPWFRVQ